MKKPASWSVAVGTGLLLTLTALVPVSGATAAPAPAAPAQAHSADLVDGTSPRARRARHRPGRLRVPGAAAPGVRHRPASEHDAGAARLHLRPPERPGGRADVRPAALRERHRPDIRARLAQRAAAEDVPPGQELLDRHPVRRHPADGHAQRRAPGPRTHRAHPRLPGRDSTITPARSSRRRTRSPRTCRTHADFLDNPLWTLERLRVLRRGGPRPPDPGHPGQAGLR